MLRDDPSLNARAGDLGPVLQPVRVIVDSSLRTPPDATTLGLEGEVMIMTLANDAAASRRLTDAGARIQVVAANHGRIDLDALLANLAELEINEVLVEAGAVLNGALLAAGLVDELIVYMSGAILGDTARGMFALPELNDMASRRELTLVDARMVGDDLRMTYQ